MQRGSTQDKAKTIGQEATMDVKGKKKTKLNIRGGRKLPTDETVMGEVLLKEVVRERAERCTL